MSQAQLETLEQEVNAELLARANAEHPDVHPITDGVVDEEQYLSSSPKILWILKEPWENGGFGSWSVTKKLIPELIAQNQIRGNPTYRKMAYVTYSVLNGFVDYSKIKYPDEDPEVRKSLEKIAYINVSKLPGKSISDPAVIASCYQRNRDILKRQVAVIRPDVIITGNIMELFYEDFGLRNQDLKSAGSVDFWRQDERLYINAYHPAYWGCKEDRYVNDLVAVIKAHYSPESSIANRIS